MAEDIYMLKLPWGKPQAVASDQRIRLATGKPDLDPEDLYLERLFDVPDEIGTTISFLDDPELGQATFLLLADDLEDVLLRTDHRHVALLTEAFESGHTTVHTNRTDGSLANSLAYSDREAYFIGSHISGGEYNVVRALFGTNEERHSKGQEIHDHLYARQFVLVELARVSRSGSYDDEKRVATYVLTDVREGIADAIELECDTLMSLLDKMVLCRNLWRGTVNATVRAPVEVIKALGVDRERPIQIPVAGTPSSGRRMLVSVDGKLALEGFWRQLDDGTYEFVWGRSERQPLNADFDLSQEIKEGTPVWEFFLTGEDQPPTFPSGDTDELPWSQNPITFCQQIILTSHTRGANGGKDLGVADLGGAFPVEAFHTESWTRMSRRYSEYKVGGLSLAYDGKQIKAMDVVRPILRALGLSITDIGGRLGLEEWRDVPEFEEELLVQQPNFRDTPGRSNNEQVRYDSVTAEIKTRLGGPEITVNVRGKTDYFENPLSDGDGLDMDVSAFTAPSPEEVALDRGLTFLERYRTGPPVLEFDGDGLADGHAGSVLLVSHAKIRHPDGKLEIVEFPCQVLGRTMRAWEQTVDYVAVMNGKGLDRYGYIAPAMKVEASNGATSGSALVAVHRNHYQDGTGESGAPAPDSFGFEKNDVVHVLDRFQTRKYTDLTMTALKEQNDETGAADPDVDQVELGPVNAVVGPILPTDIIVHANYDAVSDRVKELFISFADANGELGADNDTAYEYTG